MPSLQSLPSLTVLQGPNLGQRYLLEGPEIVLGRDASCDIVVPLPTVSRHHVRLYVQRDGVFLEDLRSMNGTRVNGRRVNQRRALEHGDRIQIHEVVLGFRSAPGANVARDMAGEATTGERNAGEQEHDGPMPGDSDNVRATAIVGSIDMAEGADKHLQVDPENKLRALVEIIRNAGTSLDIDDVLPKILESLFRIFPQATHGFVLLSEGETGRLTPRAQRRRDSESTCGSTLGPLDTAIARRVLEEGQAILSSTIDEENSDIRRTVLDLPPRAVMCAPLIVPSAAPLGAIQIEAEGATRSFSEHDLAVLASVATVAGQLVAYARWHERRRIEVAREQEHLATERERRRLRAVLDILPVGVLISDADGRLLEANPEADAVWGGKAPLSASCDDYADDYPAWWPASGRRVESHEFGLARALTKGEICHGEELAIQMPDGQRRTILNYALPIRDGKQRIVGGVAVDVDITSRKRAEEALQDADRRKDEFLAMLAHELRNPLAPIRNALAMMQAEGAEPATMLWARDMMNRQVEHLVRLVDDLLDVSRATQGKITLRTDRFELSRIVNHAVETVRPWIDRERHELTVSLPDEPLWLEGDEIRLSQVISNLLNNASKYTDQGGQIWLTAKREWNQVVLSVRDSGIGIAPEVLPRIFDLFTQADRSLDRAHGGLGIGLCLVRRLVEMHGGTVQALSPGPGQGSEFIVRLPAATNAPEPKPPPEAPTIDRQYSVLIVDDNVDAATTLAMVFRMWKHTVEVAHDGQSALAAAERSRPDLVLLDIGLPGVDGYEVAQMLRSQPSFDSTLLVAVTGYGREQDRRRSEAAGFDEHLVKPVELRSLSKLLVHPKLVGLVDQVES